MDCLNSQGGLPCVPCVRRPCHTRRSGPELRPGPAENGDDPGGGSFLSTLFDALTGSTASPTDLPSDPIVPGPPEADPFETEPPEDVPSETDPPTTDPPEMPPPTTGPPASDAPPADPDDDVETPEEQPKDEQPPTDEGTPPGGPSGMTTVTS